MAIIKGVTAAKVGDVSPYVEDIAGLKEGIVARDTRANDIRDMIAKSKAAMLKQTRDNDEDFALAQSLEKGFSSDVSGMVDAADRDYSNISKDQLQTLATMYAGKTEFRVLSEAKRNQDEANTIKQKIEANNGTVSYFGNPEYNPLSGTLYKQDGTSRKFTGNWGMEKTLDHSQAAKKLYDGIGKSLNSKEWYKNDPNFTKLGMRQLSDGTSVPDWVAYWEKHTDKTSDNWKQVDQIINGAINGFIKDNEGSQYYRLQFEDAKYKQGMNDVEAEKYARKQAQDLIFTYGESEKIDTHETKVDRQAIGRANDAPYNPPKGSAGNGSGSTIEPRQPVATGTTHYVSSHGLKGTEADKYGVVELYKNNTTEEVSDSQIAADMNNKDNPLTYNQIENNSALVTSVTMTNPAGGDPNRAKATGELEALGKAGMDIKSNQAVISFKKTDLENEDWTNTIPSNYNDYEVSNGVVTIPIPDENGNIKKKKLSAEGLMEQLGDDLFLRDEIRKASEGLGDEVSSNSSWQSILSHDDDKSDESLSTFSVDKYTGTITINPLLPSLQRLYENKLANAKSEGTKVLYEAKLLKIKDKIKQATNLQGAKPNEFNAITRKVLENNEHNKVLHDNMMEISKEFKLDTDFVENLLDGTYEAGENEGTLKTNANKAKLAADKSINLDSGIDDIDVNDSDEIKDPNGKVIYTAEESKNYKIQLKNLWGEHKNKIINGSYKASEIEPYTKGQRMSLPSTGGLGGKFWEMIDEDPSLKEYALKTNIVGKSINGVEGQEWGNNTGPIYETNKQGYIVLKEDIVNTRNQTYDNELQKAFGQSKGDLKGFVKRIESMNDVISQEKVSLYKTSTANVATSGYAEKTKEEKSVKSERGLLHIGRTILRNANFGTTAEEAFDHQSLEDAMREEHARLRDAGQLGANISYNDWEVQQLDDIGYKGIRFEPDEKGSLMVAHYEYSVGGKTYSFEHDVTKLDRYSSIKFFGVPSMYYTLGKELKDGLKQNDRLYADFQGFGGDESMRLHKANAIIGEGKERINKGEYYALYKGSSLNEDPAAGSTEYGPNDVGVRRHKFESYDDFFTWHDGRYGTQKRMIVDIESQIGQLTSTNVPPAYIFGATNRFADPSKYPNTIEGRKRIVEDLKKLQNRLSGGTNTPSGNFNNASMNDYTTAGVVKTGTDIKGNTKYNMDPKTLSDMSNEDQLNLIYTLRPDIKGTKLYQDESGQSYTADVSTMTDVDMSKMKTFNIASKNVKAKFQPNMANFVNDLNSIVSLLKQKSDHTGNRVLTSSYKVNNEDYNKLNPTELITMTSGLRSLQDNLRAYNSNGSGNISKISNSNHSRGQSIDIRTEPSYIKNKQGKWVANTTDSNRHYKGGLALWEFLKTKSGLELLKANGLRALYHKIEGNKYHIDISNASKKYPAGSSYDEQYGKLYRN